MIDPDLQHRVYKALTDPRDASLASVRVQLAAAALGGLLADPSLGNPGLSVAEFRDTVARAAVQYADATLEALVKKEEPK